jgi:hypothetical protein
MQDDEERAHGDREEGKRARKIGTDRAARRRDQHDAKRHHSGAPGKVYAGHFDTLHRAGDSKAARGSYRDRINDGVQQDRTGGIPLHQP